MMAHKMTHQLGEYKRLIQGYPASPDNVKKMEILDKQMVEMQKHSERNCRWIFATNLTFSKPVHTLHFCRWAFQRLLRVCLGKAKNTSNITRQAIKAGIPNPRSLLLDQCLDRIEACSWKLKGLQIYVHRLRKAHLHNFLIQAQDDGDKEQYKGILRTIELEEQKSIWKQIKRATDDPKLGAIAKVQQMEGLQLVNIKDIEEMNAEIQRVTEQHFDLSMSATITMSSLWKKLGFLLDTEFATNLLSGSVDIPDDVDNVTAMVLREIICLFGTRRSGHQEINLGEEQF